MLDTMKHSDIQAEELGESSTHKEDIAVEPVPNTEAARAHEFAVQHGDLTWTPEEEKKVLLKIDLWILPTVSPPTNLEPGHI